MAFLKPEASYPRLRDVPFERYYALGYRHLFLDADNTLQEHGASEAAPEAKLIVRKLQAMGFDCVLFSNASAERASSLSRSLGIDLLAGARKPQAAPLRDFIRDRGWRREQCLVIGDQLLTDIWAGQRAGVKTVRLEPISAREAWWIRPKRFLERQLMRAWGEEPCFDTIIHSDK